MLYFALNCIVGHRQLTHEMFQFLVSQETTITLEVKTCKSQLGILLTPIENILNNHGTTESQKHITILPNQYYLNPINMQYKQHSIIPIKYHKNIHEPLALHKIRHRQATTRKLKAIKPTKTTISISCRNTSTLLGHSNSDFNTGQTYRPVTP